MSTSGENSQTHFYIIPTPNISAVDRTLRSKPTEGKKHQLLTGADPSMHQEVAQRPRRPAGRSMDESNALDTSTTSV